MFMSHDFTFLKHYPLISPKQNTSEFEGLCGFCMVPKTKFFHPIQLTTSLLLILNGNANIIFVIPLVRGLTKFLIVHGIKLTKKSSLWLLSLLLILHTTIIHQLLVEWKRKIKVPSLIPSLFTVRQPQKRKNEPTIHAIYYSIRHNSSQIPLGKVWDN